MRISPLLTGRNQILPQSWWRIPLTDKSSIAGSEDAEPLAPPIKPIKPVTRNKAPQEPPVKKGRRSRRCGQCPGCQVPEDCGVCTNCLDKPKFGGRNIKKQCCKWVQVPPGAGLGCWPGLPQRKRIPTPSVLVPSLFELHNELHSWTLCRARFGSRLNKNTLGAVLGTLYICSG